jgi:hypothetical protein
MTIAEQIYSIVKTLPEAQANEVLNFAEFICAKNLSVNQSTDTVETTISWVELVDALAGTWATDFPSLEEIRAESGQDIRRESL